MYASDEISIERGVSKTVYERSNVGDVGAEGTVQEVTSQVTVKVRAVKVLSRPLVGLNTAMRL